MTNQRTHEEIRNDPLGECKYHLRRGCSRPDPEIIGLCSGEGVCPRFEKRKMIVKNCEKCGRRYKILLNGVDDHNGLCGHCHIMGKPVNYEG